MVLHASDKTSHLTNMRAAFSNLKLFYFAAWVHYQESREGLLLYGDIYERGNPAKSQLLEAEIHWQEESCRRWEIFFPILPTDSSPGF